LFFIEKDEYEKEAEIKYLELQNKILNDPETTE
jgi:hypothetical protein